MKFTCLHENLNKGLNQVSHLASKNISLPILNNVMIVCEGGVIKLSATNLEIGVNTIIRGKVEEEGKITIPAKTIADYINLLSDDKVEISSQDNSLFIASRNTKTIIKGQGVEEFPLIPLVEQKEAYYIKTKEFKKAISQTVYAVAQDESRPEISGVFLSISGETATLVATDSYRLAEKKVKLTKTSKKNIAIIIPTRTILELSRILSEEVNQLEMYFNDNQIMFVCEGVEIISRIIEGQYPDYKQIIPQEYKTTASFSREGMVKAVKGAALFSKTGINDVNIKIDPTGNKLIISSANTQLGESVAEFKAEVVGEANEIVFNHRYLLDGLSNLESSEATISLINRSNPGALMAKGDNEFTYIIMPIKQ
ncbi:DNA polymerase III subunit beta [Patescibacteria group bacterium]|nr:DNA polymerase III subunit beta [Patescibacteria group bacterium]